MQGFEGDGRAKMPAEFGSHCYEFLRMYIERAITGVQKDTNEPTTMLQRRGGAC